jgi:hypothetical protein
MGIGNYGKGKNDGPTMAPQAKAPPTPAKTVVDAVEKTIEKDLVETGEVVDRALTYEEILKEEGITLEEANKIKHAVIINGFYSETTELMPGVTVTFRTRTYDDLRRFHQEIEAYQPKFLTERDEIAMRYFLAASLESFKGTTFTFPSPIREPEKAKAAFDQRHEFILELSEVLVQKLCEILHKFDKKTRIVWSEGAVESF